jgi:amidophosphoribosyltransferase
MDDTLKDKCGVFGIYGHKDAAYLTYLGLYSLQHRGEESAGIVASDGQKMFYHKGMGHVQDVFDETQLQRLTPGDRAIGHVRYSTTGSSNIKNAQPILVDYSRGEIAIAHNGNLVNADLLRSELEAYGSIFQTTTDSETIIHLMAKPSLRNVEEGVIDALARVRGAYSLVFLTHKFLIAARDPQGFRPLWLGKKDNAYVVASETCAFDMMEAQPLREIEPGEVVFISDKGLKSTKIPAEDTHLAHCIFEHVYFSRPDSKIFGESVHLVRQRLGEQLAKEHPVAADIVIPVPDSGNSAALGFSKASGIPLEYGIIRNHYVGRTFIQPSQGIRDFKARVKFNFVKEVLNGKRVVVVDDSIVRGTTSKVRVKNLRQAGAKEVHLRISCPPHRFPCAYGIDFPTREELIANKYSDSEIKKYLDCDSVGYLSLEGMLSCVSFPKQNYCTACWTGQYSVPFAGVDKFHAERHGPKCQ